MVHIASNTPPICSLSSNTKQGTPNSLNCLILRSCNGRGFLPFLFNSTNHILEDFIKISLSGIPLILRLFILIHNPPLFLTDLTNSFSISFSNIHRPPISWCRLVQIVYYSLYIYIYFLFLKELYVYNLHRLAPFVKIAISKTGCLLKIR